MISEKDIETVNTCLNQIRAAELPYDDWLAVGMILKNIGVSFEIWDNWSKSDTRYDGPNMPSKWASFRKNGTLGIGTLVKLFRENGGEFDNDNYPSGALDWDSVLPAETSAIIRKDWIEDKDLPEPPPNWNGKADMIRYLETLFTSDERVCIAHGWQRDDKWMPTKGDTSRTAGELIEKLKSYDIDEVIGQPKECGCWVRFNPLDGQGVNDSNVTDYRYALVESDSDKLERQYAMMMELELPIAALVHSGGKSIHAIVRIEAASLEEYRKRVDFLYTICKKNGLQIDKGNKNPSRLSRLPGVMRKYKDNGTGQESVNPQYLLATNVGKETWNEWKEWIEAQNDDLPDIESLNEFIKNPPKLADELIQGILRKGHKMLVSGPSKAGKSFLLLELCVAIAEGGKWLSWQCAKGRVLYINLELDRASCYHRLKDVYDSYGIPYTNSGNIDIWHLRGKAMAMDNLAPRLIRRALKKQYAAVIIDPIYKVITGDENSADQMAKFCNQFDKVCAELQSAVIYCHHHSKGEQGGKRASDRASGSGVFSRDPDALLDMIELKITPERRETIIGRWTCDFLAAELSRTVGKQWTDDIGIDEQLAVKKMVEYAETKIGERAKSISKMVRERLSIASGWRISGILREFPAFESVRCLFTYPTHPTDTHDHLSDCLAEGEIPTKGQYKTKLLEHSKERTEQPKTIRDVFDKLSKEGEVQINLIADSLCMSEKTVRRKLYASGLECNNCIVTKLEK